MLTLYLIIKSVVCIGLLVTVKYLGRQLHWLDIIASYLITSSILQVFSNVVFLNQGLIEVRKLGITVPIIQLDRLVIIPILTLWLIFCYKKIHGKLALKYLLTIGWALLFVGLTHLNAFAQVYSLKGWNTLIGLVEMFLLYLIVMSSYFIFHTLRKKEAG